MSRHKQWHVTSWWMIPLMLLALGFGLGLWVAKLFGFKERGADLTPDDVCWYLENFISNRGDPWDWDDFTSIYISDPALEAIRHEADMIELPLEDDGMGKLRALLERAQALRPARPRIQ